MPQIYDMGPMALLPLWRKACWGFFRPKNPTASAGFEPANLGTKGQHATPRPPRPPKPFVSDILYKFNELVKAQYIWSEVYTLSWGAMSIYSIVTHVGEVRKGDKSEQNEGKERVVRCEKCYFLQETELTCPNKSCQDDGISWDAVHLETCRGGSVKYVAALWHIVPKLL